MPRQIDSELTQIGWLVCVHRHINPLVSLKHNIYIYIYRLIGQVFANGPGDLGSILSRIIPNTLKIVLGTSLLNTRQYKVRIKGKVKQSRERSGALLYSQVQQLLKREPSGCQQLRSPTLLYIYIYIYISSCRADSTDIPYPLSPLLYIIHRFWLVFRATSRILTQLLYVCSSWSSCLCLAICGDPQEYITDEFVLASPAVSCVSGSSNLDSFRDGRQVAVQLVLCGVLPPGLVQCCSQSVCIYI